MFSDWLMNSTTAVPAGLGPTARPWSGGLTSPNTGLLAALIAEVRPSKPCSPATLLLVNPVRLAAAAAFAAALLALRADGGRPSGVSCPLPAVFGAAFLPLRASAWASARRLTVFPRCRVTRPPVAWTTCDLLAAICADAAAAGTAAEASATAPATQARGTEPPEPACRHVVRLCHNVLPSSLNGLGQLR